MAKCIAALFDIDGTLIITGGAGAAAWRRAFDDLYGIPADIGEFTDTGMTDPDVGFRTFTAVLGREPTRAELAEVMERRIEHLYETVAGSDEYRVLDGVEELLPRMLEEGDLLGLVAATSRPPPTSSCTGPGSTGSSPTVATARTPPTGASSPGPRSSGRRSSPAARSPRTRRSSSATPPMTWRRPMPRGSRASGWPATTSPPSSSAPEGPTG